MEMFGRDADLHGGNEVQPRRLNPAGLLAPQHSPVARHDADGVAGAYAAGPELFLLFGQCHLPFPELLQVRTSVAPIWA